MRFASCLLFIICLCSNLLIHGACRFDFSVGYRQDDIDWKIVNPKDTTKTERSKVELEDMDIFLASISYSGCCGKSFYFEGYSDFGDIQNGTSKEKATVFNPFIPQEVVTSTAENRVKNGVIADSSLVIGVPFYSKVVQAPFCASLCTVPVFGYNFHYQKVRVKETEEILFANPDDIGKYIDYIHGVEFGVHLIFVPDSCWTFINRLGYHFGWIERKRKTNTGFEFFDDYKKTKKAHAYSYVGEVRYLLLDELDVFANFSYQIWNSNSSRDDFEWEYLRFNVGFAHLF